MSFSAELGLSKRNVTMNKLGSEVELAFHFVSARSEIKKRPCYCPFMCMLRLGLFLFCVFLEYD